MSGLARERIVSLQMLRFAAAMMVVGTHSVLAIGVVTGSVPLAFHNAATVGTAGVDIFFVLSGLVIAMTGPLATPRPSGALFFWRRWRRVAPVYFVISLPVIVNVARRGPLDMSRLAATFLFWPTAGKATVAPYLEPGWTLCFEMVFYTALAAVMVGARLRPNLILGGAGVAALIILRLAFPTSINLRFLVNPIFLEFAAGVTLARVRLRLANLPPAIGAAFLAAGASTFVVEAVIGVGDIGNSATVLLGGNGIPRLLIFGLPAVAVIAGAMICERRCRGAFAALLAKGGDASYMIYLTQFIATDAIGMLWSRSTPPPLIAASCLAGALAVGLLCHLVIERPILRDLKRLSVPWPPWRPALVAPAQPRAPV